MGTKNPELVVPELVVVVAVADNEVIGKDGGLAWHLPADLRRVKRLTVGKPLIMGRRTYESIGRPLPDRINIVVTSDPDFQRKGITIARSFEAAFEIACKAARAMGVLEIVAFGGTEIYREALERAVRIHKTEVHLSPDGDARWPGPAAGARCEMWREMWREEHSETPDGTPAHDFVTLERRPGGCCTPYPDDKIKARLSLV